MYLHYVQFSPEDYQEPLYLPNIHRQTVSNHNTKKTNYNDQVTAPTVHTASAQRTVRSMLMIIIHENDQMAKSRSI